MHSVENADEADTALPVLGTQICTRPLQLFPDDTQPRCSGLFSLQLPYRFCTVKRSDPFLDSIMQPEPLDTASTSGASSTPEQDVHSLLKGGLSQGARLCAVDAVARDGHEVASAGHGVAQRRQVPGPPAWHSE